MSKCAVILSRSLLCAGKFDERSIYHIYIFVLSENHTTSLRSLEINPNRHFVALLPRLGRLIPLICFAKGKQANQPSAEEMLFPPGIFILTALLSAAFAAPFLAEAGFKRNKGKISNLICLKPFLISSLPYAHSYHTPFPSRARSRPAFGPEKQYSLHLPRKKTLAGLFLWLDSCASFHSTICSGGLSIGERKSLYFLFCVGSWRQLENV